MSGLESLKSLCSRYQHIDISINEHNTDLEEYISKIKKIAQDHEITFSEALEVKKHLLRELELEFNVEQRETLDYQILRCAEHFKDVMSKVSSAICDSIYDN